MNRETTSDFVRLPRVEVGAPFSGKRLPAPERNSLGTGVCSFWGWVGDCRGSLGALGRRYERAMKSMLGGQQAPADYAPLPGGDFDDLGANPARARRASGHN